MLPNAKILRYVLVAKVNSQIRSCFVGLIGFKIKIHHLHKILSWKPPPQKYSICIIVYTHAYAIYTYVNVYMNLHTYITHIYIYTQISNHINHPGGTLFSQRKLARTLALQKFIGLKWCWQLGGKVDLPTNRTNHRCQLLLHWGRISCNQYVKNGTKNHTKSCQPEKTSWQRFTSIKIEVKLNPISMISILSRNLGSFSGW